MKKLKFTLLAASCACAVAASVSLSGIAFADENTGRDVTLTGTNVFYAGVGGASISAVRLTDDTEDGHTDYTSFIIGEDQTVTYRKNLAYSWYAADEDGFGTLNTFSMTVGFEQLGFESYTIALQSQQYNLTEDGVTENYLVFKPNGDALELYVSESEEIAEDETPAVTLSNYLSVDIAFGDFAGGDYALLVNGQEVGTIVNVRQNYASYVSSGDSAATPLTFSATFAEAAEDKSAEMIMYSLNGQSFEAFDGSFAEDGTFTGDVVIRDNCAPVVCLDENVNYFTHGGVIDIDYTTIDVVTTSPRTTVKYFMLSNEQVEGGADLNFNDAEDDGEDAMYIETSSSDEYKLIRDSHTFVPSLDAANGVVENEDGYSVYGLVKVALYVRDTTSSNRQEDYVFLDWYVPAQYKYDISADLTGEIAANRADTGFIKIVTDSRGASYGDQTVVDLESYKAYIAKVEEEYQAKIDDYIAKTYPDGLYASSEANLYLPDFSGYITDNLGGYTDLTYDIHYSSSATGAETGLAYNQLAIAVEEANTTYRFTIIANDAAGNGMWYFDEDGERAELSSDDIWEEEYNDLLPFFEVTVAYKPVTVEEPDVQAVGYVGSTYSSADFEITGVNNTYTAEYKLYIFDRNAFYADTKNLISYDEVVKNITKLMNDTYLEGVNTRKYFHTVTDDEEYEDLSWNADSQTFIPQDASVFYVVGVTLQDTTFDNYKLNAYLVVRASERANELYGEDNWLENNVTAIVLFCVAGVCFIAFIVLLVVKPKDKGDIDEIAVRVAESKKGKGKK